eukprot:gene9904-13324_t
MNSQSKAVTSNEVHSINMSVKKWSNTSVSLDMPIGISQSDIFSLYSDLEKHPQWSPWLEKVLMNRTSGISQWTLKKFGVRLTWQANNTKVVAPHIIEWESIDSAFPNRGRAEFITNTNNIALSTEQKQCENDTSEFVTLKLTISYLLPSVISIVLKAMGSVAQNYISDMILDDLKRFRSRFQ